MVKNGSADILVSGSLAYDEVYIYGGEFRDHLPPSRDDALYINLRARGPIRRFGGCGGNTAYTLSLLGVRTALSSWLGEDGDRYLSYLRDLGVDVSRVLLFRDRATPTGALLVDRRGDHVLFFGDEGSNLDLSLPDVNGISLAVITAGVPENMLFMLQHCHKASVPTVVDAGKIIMDVDVQDLLRSIEGADTLILNKYERDLLVRQSGMPFNRIAESVGTAIITAGREDITLLEGGRRSFFPVVRAQEEKDASGAGDAFLAGYAFGRLRGFSTERCVAIAATAASFAVETTGTQQHSFTPDMFQKRLEISFGKQNFNLSTNNP